MEAKRDRRNVSGLQSKACCIVTVPIYFNDAQRQATKDAGTIAGLIVERVINEPTAAAIAYGMDWTSKIEWRPFSCLIWVAERLMSHCSQSTMGGEDFDQRLMEYCIQQFKRQNDGVDISSDKRAVQRLRNQCELAKRTLSTDSNIGDN